jgi:vitamin B12/bleomycin/antimicrobial peptide transport system ATP-binding/permease protein
MVAAAATAARNETPSMTDPIQPRDGQPRAPSQRLPPDLSSRPFLARVWTLTRPFWFSEERWMARGMLLGVIGLSLLLVYMQVLINFWGNRFYNSLEEKAEADFWALILYFCFLAACYIGVAVYKNYLQSMLTLRWRRWLTEVYVQEWLGSRAYYLLEQQPQGTDNPDQRIASDLNAFAGETLGLALAFLNAGVSLVSFLGILWVLSGSLELDLPVLGAISVPGYMVWVAVVYAAVGTWLAHLIGRPLIGLNFNQEKCEADFRYGLVRVRENAESIAVYRGEGREGEHLGRRFTDVVQNFLKLMIGTKRLQWFTTGYGQVAIIFPYLVTAPRYFRGDFRLGDVMQTASAFGKVQESLSIVVDAYGSIASWKASVDRLTTFHEAIAASASITEREHIRFDEAGRERPEVAQALELQGVTVKLPDGLPLLPTTTLRLEPGHHTVITGPSGIGKSTLFRVLCGIWPWGNGLVKQPAGSRVLFLPQRPYLPIGTLRDALAYPFGTGEASDDRLRELLHRCHLGNYAGRLDESDNWGRRLSPGEQQRLGFARALLHRPDWLFLDEATSALDGGIERELYDLLFAELGSTTVVSIAHREQVARHHTQQWRFEAGESGTHVRVSPVAEEPA